MSRQYGERGESYDIAGITLVATFTATLDPMKQWENPVKQWGEKSYLMALYFLHNNRG